MYSSHKQTHPVHSNRLQHLALVFTLPMQAHLHSSPYGKQPCVVPSFQQWNLSAPTHGQLLGDNSSSTQHDYLSPTLSFEQGRVNSLRESQYHHATQLNQSTSTTVPHWHQINAASAVQQCHMDSIPLMQSHQILPQSRPSAKQHQMPQQHVAPYPRAPYPTVNETSTAVRHHPGSLPHVQVQHISHPISATTAASECPLTTIKSFDLDLTYTTSAGHW